MLGPAEGGQIYILLRMSLSAAGLGTRTGVTVCLLHASVFAFFSCTGVHFEDDDFEARDLGPELLNIEIPKGCGIGGRLTPSKKRRFTA